MSIEPPGNSGFTWTETLVLLCLIAILVGWLLPKVVTVYAQDSRTRTISNMKQLHLATQQMALDGTTTGNTNIGWPGDIGGTFTNWTTQLLKGSYLNTNDLCKLLSAPEKVVLIGKIPPMSDTAVLVYTVREESGGETVFLTTANFTNTPTGGLPLEPSAKPYGTKALSSSAKPATAPSSFPSKPAKPTSSAPTPRSANRAPPRFFMAQLPAE